MKRIYCISGLGADHRLFQNISIPGFELVPVHWAPYDGIKDLPAYARKLQSQIQEEDAVILGLSFGGMLAVELAKLNPRYKVFIVSSVKVSAELAIFGGTLSKLLIRSGIIASWMYGIPHAITLKTLGSKTKAEKDLLKAIMRDSDGRFSKWALKTIITWKNDVAPENVVLLHGTHDKTIPSVNVHPDHWVQGGTHIMIYSQGDEVSRIIAGHLGA